MGCRKWEVEIIRRHEGTLDHGAKARLLRHLGSCIKCRNLADKFSEIDRLFVKSQEPSLPPFIKERIVTTVSEAMRKDSMRGIFWQFFSFLASFRPGVAWAVLVLGIGIGVMTGWNLARSMPRDSTRSSYDLLSLAEIGSSEGQSSLEFIWTDSNGRTGR
jgi:predicted anti-sigma-YlaC factor YlaD